MEPTRRARRSQLLHRWMTWVGVDPAQHDPGFIGPVPYILLLRYFILAAVAGRFWLHKTQYAAGQWNERLLLIGLFGLATIFASYIALKPSLRRSRALQGASILPDLLFISVAYWLTYNPESDFFLFYYLPIFAAVVYLGNLGGAFVCGLAGMAVAVVLYTMPIEAPPPWTHEALLLRVFIPRAVFFLIVVLSSAIVFQRLSRRQAQLGGLLRSMHAIGAAVMPSAQALDRALESIFSELRDNLKFEFATVSLVDEYRNCIETVRGWNVPPGWIKRARHPLHGSDIKASIVETCKSEVIEGWDPRFDPEIYNRFEHGRFARIFAPIVANDGRVVGTIEAGCAKERRSEVITDATRARVELVGRTTGEAIATNRPHALLELIGSHAMQLVGADSASLHVYRDPEDSEADGGWGDLVLAAGAGRATPEFLSAYKPSPQGLGRAAIRSRKPLWVDDAGRFEHDYPIYYNLGMRALAVIPFEPAPGTKALLGVHFWRTGHRFSPEEIESATAFVREIEVGVQNYLMFRSATEAAGRSWALSGLQSLMQSITSPFHLQDILKKVAKSALWTLDADNVAVYVYRADQGAFEGPPVTDGRFLSGPGQVGVIAPSTLPFKIVQEGESRFFADADREPILTAPREDGTPRFTKLESIKSCAILVLRPPETGEVVGLMFVNFRERHNFSSEEKGVMNALATAAALAIRTARLHEATSDRRRRELEVMQAVDTAIVERGANLTQVLECLLERMLALTGAKHGVFMWLNQQSNRLEPMARWPMLEDRVVPPQEIGQGIIGVAAVNRKSILINDVKEDALLIPVEGKGDVPLGEIYHRVNEETRCELAVPILDKDRKVLGVLNIEHTEPGGLKDDDLRLLEALAVPATIALHSVSQYELLKRRIEIQPVEALSLIATSIQDPRYDLETILRLVLTGLTAGEGLAFSRAIVFLRENNSLAVKLAIGPRTLNEAERTWSTLQGRSLPSLLDDAIAFQSRLKQGAEDTDLGSFLRGFGVKMDKAGALTRCLCDEECVHKGAHVLVADGHEDDLRYHLRFISLDHAFMCLPLLGREGNVLGALLVDKRFLVSEREIDPATIPIAKTFAQLAAMSVENDRLRHDAELRSRLAAWKNVAGIVEHQFKGYISTLAQERAKLLKPGTAGITGERAKALFNTLERKAETLRSLVAQFEKFGLPPSESDYTDINLGDLLNLVVKSFEDEDIATACTIEPDDRLSRFKGVQARLEYVFIELMKNALSALASQPNQKGKITVTAVAADGEACLEFIDNGPGIPEDRREKIFNFKETSKGEGHGMGLFIVRRTIEDDHKGSITVAKNNDGEQGARFVIKIPFQRSPRNGV